MDVWDEFLLMIYLGLPVAVLALSTLIKLISGSLGKKMAWIQAIGFGVALLIIGIVSYAYLGNS